ncbi:hypothetical protein O181_046363 [Austropuccinia psidii MF-1]|uniref:Uncharacterized protein n=1 Tax=Austropuccinia psidii MF-1 TaxID=1389203 RepID=A0A9Q3HIH0_9BASI|nr:hypothetical protein [Austropuccinia psidii MF-1]
MAPSVLCGSGILSQLASPWSMASSGHFDPGQTYDGYKAIASNISIQNLQSAISALLGRIHVIVLGQRLPMSKVLCGLVTGSRQRDVARWTNAGGSIPVGGRPIYSSSEVPISRINTEVLVKQIRHFADSSPYPDAEGRDELNGEEVEVVDNPVGHQSSSSPSQPPAKRFQRSLIPITPRNFQPTLATIPTSLPLASP